MYFNYTRRTTQNVLIGKELTIGSSSPIRVQSMANVPLSNLQAAVDQSIRMIEAGAELVRFAAPGEKDAEILGQVREKLEANSHFTPLVADIHFTARTAMIAATKVQKVRINPGNFVTQESKLRERFIQLIELCKANNTALRIGVNHGSLSERMKKLYGNTPLGLVESCLEFLRICKEQDFHNVVISVKSSNTSIMVHTVRLMIERIDSEGLNYPIHLGVTEAGEGEDGRIKSAAGIGTLLADGIGDTIRVSLSEDPVAEMPVAKKLVEYINLRKHHAPINGKIAENFNPINPVRRASKQVKNIGGTSAPAVIASSDVFDSMQTAELKPDFSADDSIFTHIDAETLSEAQIATLRAQKHETILILNSSHTNYVGSMRAAIHLIMRSDWDVPIILRRDIHETDKEITQLMAAADFGALLLDGFADGIMLNNPHISSKDTCNIMFATLQAIGLRISKTEYISCPTCGRTNYDLQTTTTEIKAATNHLKGLKIAIMGCVVNGPGEMADADYGCLGSGNNKVSIYKGKQCIIKNVAQKDATAQLINLIKQNNQWKEKAI